MSGDYSRQRFDPLRDFSGVLMQQGRVQLDADWNEQVDILDRRLRAETLDVVGRCGVPRLTPLGFKIDVDKAGQLTIGRGRIYLDGLLAENHGGGELKQREFDGVLSESRGAIDVVPFSNQPYLRQPVSPTKAGKYLVYLDVWTREVTFLEEPNLIEIAVGVDTTTRRQTIWQVKILPKAVEKETECGTPDDKVSGWPDVVAPSAARLSTSVVDVPNEKGPCLLPPTVGYRGLDNRLYRVELHRGGTAKQATFKWSRDNASNGATVTGIPALDKLTVDQTGRDEALRFKNGDWIEITDDARALAGQAGVLRKIALVDPGTRTITLKVPLAPADGFAVAPDEIKSRHTLIRRWDQAGADAEANQGAWPVPNDGKPVTLEDGIQVTFNLATKDGEYHVGDYWVFAARTADAKVEPLQNAAPRGIHHHFGRLALAEFDGAKWTMLSDCRIVFPSLTNLTNFSYVSGDGQEVAPDPTQPALFVPLAQPLQTGVANVGVPGGQGPVAGAAVRYTITLGAGRLQGAGNNATVATDAIGVASCKWELDSTTPNQQVEAVLLDGEGQPFGLPVRFNANLSVAARVAYQPKDCPTLAGVTNVQDAIDRLCQATHGGGGCCVSVGKDGDFGQLDEAINQLLKRGVFDVCLCLMPGDHKLLGFAVQAPTDAAVNLRIAGCGRATRLTIVERAWTISGLRSLALTDLTLLAGPIVNPLQIDRCDEVTLRGCDIEQVADADAKSLVTITNAQRVQVSDNVISAKTRLVIKLPQEVFRGVPEMAELTATIDEGVRRFEVTPPLLELATSTAELRKGLASRINRNLIGLRAQLAEEDVASYTALLQAITADAPVASVLAERLQAVFFRSTPGVALVLAGTTESCLLENNTIVGAVSLYGEPSATDLSLNQLKQFGLVLADLTNLAPDLFAKAQGTLRLVGNRLTRLTISEKLVQSLADLPNLLEGRKPTVPLDGITKLTFLTDNIFESNGNKILGTQFSFSSNSFSHLGSGKEEGPVAGWVVSLTALFQGNQAPIAPGFNTLLRNVSGQSFPPVKATLNFILAIVDLAK